MTFCLTKLYNVNQTAQRLIAYLLFVVAVVCVFGVAFLIYHDISSRQENITTQRLLLGQLQKAAALKSQLESNDVSGKIRSGIFLQGDSDAVAGANLQALITSMALASNVTISSISNMPKNTRANVELLGLKVILNGPLEAVNAVVLEIETATPPLLIEKTIIQSVRRQRKKNANNIAVNLEVYGARDPIDTNASANGDQT